jgi:hypothetical protein
MPSDPTTAVIIDGDYIPIDVANGWRVSSGGTAILLNGTACGRVNDGAAHQVQVVAACPTCPIPLP